MSNNLCRNIFMSFLLLICGMPLSAQSGNGFLEKQKRYPRVRTAISEKQHSLRVKYDALGLNPDSSELFIRIFKRSQLVELWAKHTAADTFQLLSSYDICSLSGQSGPKRREGDYQIPEGFYYIDRFNPASNFHLSLGINYPNQSDRILSDRQRPGGDIFIHGACVTIGCVPITDEWIKELYLACVWAKSSGQKKIPVHIFPDELSGEKYEALRNKFRNDTTLLDFWENLKTGYEYFLQNKKLPSVTVRVKDGSYLYGEEE